MQRTRCGGFGILDLRRRQTCREQGKYSTSDLLRIHAWIAVYAIVNALQEDVSSPGRRACAGMPTFIVKATQQRRQLSSNVDCFITP